jgi:hypothetical protein
MHRGGKIFLGRENFLLNMRIVKTNNWNHALVFYCQQTPKHLPIQAFPSVGLIVIWLRSGGESKGKDSAISTALM